MNSNHIPLIVFPCRPPFLPPDLPIRPPPSMSWIPVHLISSLPGNHTTPHRWVIRPVIMRLSRQLSSFHLCSRPASRTPGAIQMLLYGWKAMPDGIVAKWCEFVAFKGPSISSAPEFPREKRGGRGKQSAETVSLLQTAHPKSARSLDATLPGGCAGMVGHSAFAAQHCPSELA